MTETEMSEDVRAVVEDTELPRRLKTQVYETIASREGSVSVQQADEIARAVETRYLATRVDPLDPVGTVSAQSIGEPGTQMSVPADERVVVRSDGHTAVPEIGSLVDGIVRDRETRAFDGHEVARAPDDLEVLSLRSDERIQWQSVEEVSRHDAPDQLLRFELESGRTIRATKAHSFVTRRNNEVIPIAGDELEPGDWLPVVAEFDGGLTDEIDLRTARRFDRDETTSSFPATGTPPLTDGGIVSDNHRRGAASAGDSPADQAGSSSHGSATTERFPLDEGTGFIIGAFLARGTLSDRSVTISPLAPAVRERIQAVTTRFDSSSAVDDAARTPAGSDAGIRVTAPILVDGLRTLCLEHGDRVVPAVAYGAPDEFVSGLLAGFVSAAGTVELEPTSVAIRCSSAGERLTEGLALLLARIGVYATLATGDGSTTFRVRGKHVDRFVANVDLVGPWDEQLAGRLSTVGQGGSAGRTERSRPATDMAQADADRSPDLDALERAVDGDVVWERIDAIETVQPDHKHVYDLSVGGLDTFTTAQGVVTHNTMNTFHYAGVAEIDVTQGLPRLIELVDARKTPDTPMMTVHLEGEAATDREKAHEVVWQIESTKILALGDISTNVAEMQVRVDLNEDTLRERWFKLRDEDDTPIESDEEQLERAVGDVVEGIESNLKKVGQEGIENLRAEGTVIQFEPGRTSYRDLLLLVEELREVVFKGIEEVSRVVVKKETADDGVADDHDEEFVLYTEGSALSDVLDIDGVDSSRTTSNNIHEIYENLGIEAARNAIINETMDTLEEQGLDEVNIRHLMLVADIMTNRGEIESIGRHGISGSKESVLARAAFEVTVNHLLEAAIHGEVDDLNGVTENVIVGKPIKLGTGDVDLRMGSFTPQTTSDAD